MTYQALFERADDGSVFAYVPDLPGCTSWGGATLDDARAHVREAIVLWMSTVRAQGGVPPQPSAIAAAAIDVGVA